MSDPRYPIGKFSFTPFSDSAARAAAIAEIRDLPKQLRAAVASRKEAEIDSPYREGGWTIRQLIHHVADSHMNAFIRFRLGLTEDKPTIKPYEEQEWAKLPDSDLPIEISLAILDNLHHRWTVMLELLPDEVFSREIVHPVNGAMTLDKLLQLYCWHGKHHVAHVVNAPKQS